jgi:hypothetical protein
MNEQPTPEMLAKLPKWAQKHIEDLDRRVVISERTLKEYRDVQTPSEFFVEDWTGKTTRNYIQTHKVAVERNGIRLDVLLRLDEKGIDLSWSDDSRLVREIAMVPIAFNSVRLLRKEHMR